MTQTQPAELPEPLRARRSLVAGVATLRWASYGWMVVANIVEGDLSRPLLAALLIVGAGAWTAFVTIVRERPPVWAAWLDLALGCAIIVLSGVVVDPMTLDDGSRLFFAATYPIGVAVAWGEARGPWGGLAATMVMGLALTASRPANELALAGIDYGLIANGMVAYLLAGLAGGVTSAFLGRWAVEHELMQEASVRAHERAARYAEREKLARQIHDSVLQALALVEKRGRELASQSQIDPEDVGELAGVAAREERALRALIAREPEEAPTGSASLRDALEELARTHDAPPVTVSTVGPLFVPAHVAAEVAAAVAQALSNVTRHAGATRVTVHADLDDGVLSVNVRDDGRGFVYDEDALADAGKAGLLRSMKGRLEDLGGTMSVDSAPGRGTDIEFTIRT